MSSPLERFTKVVGSKLHDLGHSSPNTSILRALINTAYLATLRTEEGRFVRGSLTFADPRNPEPNPPLLRRANYPAFTPFSHPIQLTVERLVKLSRAVDSWCGSIAVYGLSSSAILAWGVLDQLVQHNVRLQREGLKGFSPPGVLTVVMEGVGALSAYHDNLFLGGVRQDQIVTREQDALGSAVVADRLHSVLKPIAVKLSRALGDSITSEVAERRIFEEWSGTVARICIGLRRAGTGGALLISPKPIEVLLDTAQHLPYSRLGHAAVLRVLDIQYRSLTREALLNYARKNVAPIDLIREEHLADADAADREDELAGSVRIVTSLASVDGLVLLTPLLEVIAFGAKVRSGPHVNRVYVGHDFVRRGVSAKHVDISRFGTRHTSILRYCRADRRAIGIVVSQDGQVRLITSMGKSLTLWDNVQLLERRNDLRGYARMIQRARTRSGKLPLERSLGYTEMPKTLKALLQSKPSIKKIQGGQ